MKILRSKGQSFTKIAQLTNRTVPQLARGLVEKSDGAHVEPEKLADYIRKDFGLQLRQMISVLDKTIKKPRKLRQFEIRAYEDRVKLAEALWKLLEIDLRLRRCPEEDVASFRSMWLSKAHPYARKAVDRSNPASDGNAVVISKGRSSGKANSEKTREYFSGRWSKTFWQTDGRGFPDYDATAKTIMAHLTEQERILHDVAGKVRKKKGEPSATGLVENRAQSIVASTNDPREGRFAQKREAHQWSTVAEDLYFTPDIAMEIYGKSIETSREKPVTSADFGNWLYKHFGTFLDRAGTSDELKNELWSLHNQVRAYYQKLGKSERFRLACLQAMPEHHIAQRVGERPLRHDDGARLKSLVPEDKDALLRAIGAKSRNANFSELIRLGKLVAHATDLSPGVEATDALFHERLDYFATSEGQAEIKRNESFVRVWRNSAGHALRSLAALVDPFHKVNEDLLDPAHSKRAAKDLNIDFFKSHLQLLFGDRKFARTSRSDIFLEEGGDPNELAWALMRVAGTIRNKTNHFMFKQRLVELVKTGIVSAPTPLSNFDNRGRDIVSEAALEQFAKLLKLDLALERQIIVDSLTTIKAEKFVTQAQADALIKELGKIESADDVIVPRFMSVLTKAKNLQMHSSASYSPPLRQANDIELKDFTKSSDSNKCKVGLLRLLYNSGFQNWLQCASWMEVDSTFISDKVCEIIAGRSKRREAAQEKELRFYKLTEDWLENANLDRFESLDALFSAMASLTARESETRHRYSPDRREQQTHSGLLESFKQELVATLFDVYLNLTGLEWIWDIANEQPAEERASFAAIGSDPPSNPEAWECQFYVWLYLLPMTTVAGLRHQFRKTHVLEGKSVIDPAAIETKADKARDALSAIDRLMALYTRVQGAGFAGTEHSIDPKIATRFYVDPDLFNKVFSNESEHSKTSIDGTRRGLRHIMRFGDMRVLTPIFDRHKVSSAEVEFHLNQEPDVAAALFGKKHEIHREISSLSENLEADPTQLTQLCADYQEIIVNTTFHNFSVRAARLEDHIRLHQLMMKVTGRLLDFTLMWERDRLYILLGMLYRQWQGDAGMTMTQEADNIGVARTADENSTFVPLWNAKDGFALHEDRELNAKCIELLETGNRALFKAHFYSANKFYDDEEKVRQHEYDARSARLAKQQTPPGKTRVPQFGRGKIQIRHDFAHYNTLRPGDPKRFNMTYQVNAVRSLFSYDRKLKNAVSLAIADLLESEGVTIEWKMHEDRLRHPLVLPVIETHLSTVRAAPQRAAPVLVPRSSARFTSMVKALFDFDKGGCHRLVTEDAKRKAKGPLCYPDELVQRCNYQMPEAFYRESP